MTFVRVLALWFAGTLLATAVVWAGVSVVDIGLTGPPGALPDSGTEASSLNDQIAATAAADEVTTPGAGADLADDGTNRVDLTLPPGTDGTDRLDGVRAEVGAGTTALLSGLEPPTGDAIGSSPRAPTGVVTSTAPTSAASPGTSGTPSAAAPVTQTPITQTPTTQAPTRAPVTQAPTTQPPQTTTTRAPATQPPTTQAPTTAAPTAPPTTAAVVVTQTPTTAPPPRAVDPVTGLVGIVCFVLILIC